MKLLRVISTILSHPNNKNQKLKSLGRFIWWQVAIRTIRLPVVYSWIGSSKFIVSRGDTGLTGNIYCSLLEYEDMSYLLDNLKSDDLFVDIGANLGAYTILASKVIGARTISIEPIPSTFSRLRQNIYINEIDDKVELHNVGLADKTGVLRFSDSQDTENRVLLDNIESSVEVNVSTLDEVLRGREPSMMKIDVEGYELPVLKGAKNLLKNKFLRIIILELNDSGLKYGYDNESIVSFLSNYGFVAQSYDVQSKTLTKKEYFSWTGNVIFLRDEGTEKFDKEK